VTNREAREISSDSVAQKEIFDSGSLSMTP
jgi:hypothetical protein